jgi:hypothetical protein
MCREVFGDPERYPDFESWEVLVIMHMIDEHGVEFEAPISDALFAVYSNRAEISRGLIQSYGTGE